MNPVNEALQDLLVQLDVEPIGENLFRGQHRPEPRPRVFGGLVAAQALVAAARTVPDVAAHSLHAYFLRSGDTNLPIEYEVTRIRDGRSFSTRLVTASQNEQPIFHMSASFHNNEPGLHAHIPAPVTPAPEDCMSWSEWMQPWVDRLPPSATKYMLRERPIEMRVVDPPVRGSKDWGNTQRFWLRAAGELPNDPLLHQSLAVYASDHTLLGVALRPHGKTFMHRDVMATSLDHAMWLHQPLLMNEWHLYVQISPQSFGGRGLAFGHLFTQDGRLVASMTQEGLMRTVDPSQKSRA